MRKIIEHILRPGGFLEDFALKKIFGAEKILEEFEYKTKNFIKEQEETLDAIIEKNEGTKWGRDHKFSKLNHQNWDSVPIVTYEQVEPYIKRIRKGDFYALTHEPPEALIITSGTSSKPKLIQLTKGSIESQQRGADIWNLMLRETHKENLNKLLILRGGAKHKDLESLPVKSYTDVIKEKQSVCVQKRMIFPKEAESVTDFEHRLLISAQQAFIRQPTALISANPISILRLLELTEENRAEIGRATLKRKYIGTNIDISEIKEEKKILENIFSKNPLDSVKLIGTWLGGTQYLFIDQLRKRGIKASMRDLGYLASEGRFTIPSEDNTPLGILNPFGVYYEFTTLDKKNLVSIQELKQGEEYNIIITGENGLYKYDMQDIIRIEGWHNQAPMISFRRKDSCFSSITGEKLHENHITELFKKLKIEEGFLVANANPPYYVLNLPQRYNNLNAEAIDKMLQEINPEYLQKRENNRLKSLEIKLLNKQEFQELDKKINPNQEHDRFKRKYLVPLPVG